MLSSLTDRLSQIMKKVKGWGSLNEKNIRDGLREIKLALLEADVNYKVVKKPDPRTAVHKGCARLSGENTG